MGKEAVLRNQTIVVGDVQEKECRLEADGIGFHQHVKGERNVLCGLFVHFARSENIAENIIQSRRRRSSCLVTTTTG